MTILDTILFGMLAGAITLKAALLATAAVLLVYALTAPFRRRKDAPAGVGVKHSRLDVHA